MKKINELDVNNKTVVLRLDLNVPTDGGVVVDDTRIKKAAKTINYLYDNNAKIVILSHFGRIKSEEDKLKYDLKVVVNNLSNTLGKNVIFLSECYGDKVKSIIDTYPSKSIILLQNTRYMDYPLKKESSNDLDLAKYWASLGDIFINDAFGSSHREHASVAGIAKYIPNAIGFLVEEELNSLDALINIEKRPYTVFMGGAKVEDKLPIIKKIITKCDYILLGGGILNSFLKASGIDVKDSLATNDEEVLKELKKMLDIHLGKIIMSTKHVMDNNKILDIDVSEYEDYILNSKLIFVNGAPGMFEEEKYQNGTKELLKMLDKSDAKVILGGGDTINAINKFGYENSFDFISSGGGASLEYISDGTLKALEWINK